MKLQMVGLTAGSDRQIVSGEPAENKFSVFHYAGGRLIGIESVNRPADHMLGRKMMGAGLLAGRGDRLTAGSDALKAALAEWQARPALRPEIDGQGFRRQRRLKVLPSSWRHGSGASKIQMAGHRRDRRRRVGRARGHDGAAPAGADSTCKDRALRPDKAEAAETVGRQTSSANQAG